MSLDFCLSLLCEVHNVSVNSDQSATVKVNALLRAAGIPPYMVLLKSLENQFRDAMRFHDLKEPVTTINDGGFATVTYHDKYVESIVITVRDDGYKVNGYHFDDADSVVNAVIAEREDLYWS